MRFRPPTSMYGEFVLAIPPLTVHLIGCHKPLIIKPRIIYTSNIQRAHHGLRLSLSGSQTFIAEVERKWRRADSLSTLQS